MQSIILHKQAGLSTGLLAMTNIRPKPKVPPLIKEIISYIMDERNDVLKVLNSCSEHGSGKDEWGR